MRVRSSKLLFSLSMLVILLLSLTSTALNAQDDDTPQGTPDEICENATPAEEPETREYEGAEEVLEEGVDYRAILCTDVGAIYVDLYETLTPITVNNFVFLSQNDYYNNTNFHRVLEDFMAQAGDPTNIGTGGPGYRFVDEYVGFLNFNRIGLLAMANTGQPITNGSQFFLTTSLPTHLNFAHTIFGDVLVGQDVVESIELRDPQSATDDGTALNTVVIITDPELVDAEVPEIPPATEEMAQEILDNLPDLGLPVDDNVTGIFSANEVVMMLAEDIRGDAETFLGANNHRYSVGVSHINEVCDLTNPPFMRVKYTLHTFTSFDDASNVIADDFLVDFITNGSEYAESEGEILTHPMYMIETTACNQDAMRVVTFWQRGRSVAVAEVLLPIDDAAEAESWLHQVIGIQVYEFLLTDLLTPEIRAD